MCIFDRENLGVDHMFSSVVFFTFSRLKWLISTQTSSLEAMLKVFTARGIPESMCSSPFVFAKTTNAGLTKILTFAISVDPADHSSSFNLKFWIQVNQEVYTDVLTKFKFVREKLRNWASWAWRRLLNPGSFLIICKKKRFVRSLATCKFMFQDFNGAGHF